MAAKNNSWRLIFHGKSNGAQNMAVDEALLEEARISETPVLRFYGWNPACISIGRLQKVPAALQKSTFDWVRRPTGGRAVLHQHEITYCAILPESILGKENRSVIGAYNWLSEGFITGLKQLGINANLAPAHRGKTFPDNCFSAPAQCDFVVDGRKLIGAAQYRRYGIILQHGAILMKIDAKSWQTALNSAMNGAVSLQELGVHTDEKTIANALASGLKTRHQIQLEKSELNLAEQTLATKLHRIKYAQPAWNQEGKDPTATGSGGVNS